MPQMKKTINIAIEKCVLIDNPENNLAEPRILGMKAIYFEHAECDVKLLRETLSDIGM